jgi:hypothetical protein
MRGVQTVSQSLHALSIAKIAKPTIEISDRVRLNLEKFV